MSFYYIINCTILHLIFQTVEEKIPTTQFSQLFLIVLPQEKPDPLLVV